MIIVFIIAFGSAVISTFTGFLRSAAYHSRIFDCYDTSPYDRVIRRRRLRKHHLITLALYALAVYAAYNL